MSYAASEQDRRLAGISRPGTVTAVDPERGRARVTFGGTSESEWLSWLAPRASGVRFWAPPAVGEQVQVLSGGGDTAQGVILGSLFRDGDAPSARGDEVAFDLGEASFRMVPDRIVASVGAGSLTVEAGRVVLAVGGASVVLDAAGLHVDAPDLEHSGTDIGREHVHEDVVRGSEESGSPV